MIINKLYSYAKLQKKKLHEKHVHCWQMIGETYLVKVFCFNNCSSSEIPPLTELFIRWLPLPLAGSCPPDWFFTHKKKMQITFTSFKTTMGGILKNKGRNNILIWIRKMHVSKYELGSGRIKNLASNLVRVWSTFLHEKSTLMDYARSVFTGYYLLDEPMI